MIVTEEGAYENFFRLAFSKNAEDSHEPFDYQTRLATEKDFPSLLNAPTGAGKTNAVLGAWLWRRLYNPETVGRRLIYCLPMRTLVEQTRAVAESAIDNLINAGVEVGGKKITSEKFSVHTLYGGDVSDDWDIFPEREQIIVGTQDLLLSRALNRGYAINRFRWAFHFGLLNNDCLWVFDEVQLFGDGLATTAQLAAMRDKFQTFGVAKSLWMSATLDKDWLKTVDFGDKVGELESLELSAEDRENSELKKRLNAVKVLRKAESDCRLPNGLAKFAMEKHERGTQTLIVVNTVARAQEVFAELEKLYAEAEKLAKKSSEPTLYESQTEKPEIKLLHSRFRPAERKEWKEIFTKKIDENGSDKSINRIIVATQVIEAGVDISSKLLITDIAPFPSLVQRFGRVNRTGEFDSAEIFWIDLPLLTKHKDKFAATDLSKLDDKTLAEIVKIVKPYEWESLEKSRTILKTIDSASPNDLEEILKNSENREKYTPNHVLRQRDLIDLFDTTADLSGFDLDVSRFVRGGEERDVSFYWRENAETKVNEIKEALKLNEARETKRPKVSQKTFRDWNKALSADRSELCSVQLFRAKEFLKNKTAWTFDALRKEFVKVDANNLRTGMIILLDVKEGGYNNKEGWHGKSAKSAKDYLDAVPPDDPNARELSNESFDDDEQTYETKIEKNSGDGKENKFISYTQTLTAHSREVKQAAVNILDKLDLSELAEFSEQIISAAHHHDLGKAHPVFQATVQKIDKDTPLENIIFGEFLAKATSGGKHRRKKFRHELASALALLEAGKSDLEIYLAAAHHGKVRLSIRALPDETKPPKPEENIQPEKKSPAGSFAESQARMKDFYETIHFDTEMKSVLKAELRAEGKFARGIWDGDELPETDLGDGLIFPETILNLDAMLLGGHGDGKPSWLERMLRLRDELGVFRLAYLEAIVRAADVQASANPQDYFEKGEAENDK